MLTLDHVKSLVDRHQKKAAEHIEFLKVIKNGGVSLWLRNEDIVLYWSHLEVGYLPLNTLDYIDYYLKRVQVTAFIDELDKIKGTNAEKLHDLYFDHLSRYWKKQGVRRPEISKEYASEEFLDRVFKF